MTTMADVPRASKLMKAKPPRLVHPPAPQAAAQDDVGHHLNGGYVSGPPPWGRRGPQIIDIPSCEKCGREDVKIVTTQSVQVENRPWRRQKYRCACGHISIIMRKLPTGRPIVRGEA